MKPAVRGRWKRLLAGTAGALAFAVCFMIVSGCEAFGARARGARLAAVATDPRTFVAIPSTGLRVTRFGHSSMLLEIDGHRVLTDPVWPIERVLSVHTAAEDPIVARGFQ